LFIREEPNPPSFMGFRVFGEFPSSLTHSIDDGAVLRSPRPFLFSDLTFSYAILMLRFPFVSPFLFRPIFPPNHPCFENRFLIPSSPSVSVFLSLSSFDPGFFGCPPPLSSSLQGGRNFRTAMTLFLHSPCFQYHSFSQSFLHSFFFVLLLFDR